MIVRLQSLLAPRPSGGRRPHASAVIYLCDTAVVASDVNHRVREDRFSEPVNERFLLIDLASGCFSFPSGEHMFLRLYSRVLSVCVVLLPLLPASSLLASAQTSTRTRLDLY